MTGNTREIRHSFLIGTRPEAIADALTRADHIQKWWTKEAHVEDGKGVFRWSGHGWTVELDMDKDATTQTVTWKCTKSNMQDTDAWEGTTIAFRLTPEEHGTRLAFAQTGYRASPCYEICNQGWAFFVGESLKRYLETGTGIPYPEMQDTSKV
jgi:uncharacterized protein YndB with AHSA1/START domain